MEFIWDNKTKKTIHTHTQKIHTHTKNYTNQKKKFTHTQNLHTHTKKIFCVKSVYENEVKE